SLDIIIVQLSGSPNWHRKESSSGWKCCITSPQLGRFSLPNTPGAQKRILSRTHRSCRRIYPVRPPRVGCFWMPPSTISVALRLHPLLVLCGCLPTLRRPDPQLLLLRLLLNLVVEVQPLRPVLSSALAVDSCQAALQQLLADVLFERAGPVGHHAHHPLVLVPTEHLHRDGFALKLLSSEGCGVIAPGLAGFTKLGGLRGVHCSDAYHDGVLGKLALELSIREKGLVADAIGI
ncbi:unnamed protein product, partial [Heterosigma akashiwo]